LFLRLGIEDVVGVAEHERSGLRVARKRSRTGRAKGQLVKQALLNAVPALDECDAFRLGTFGPFPLHRVPCQGLVELPRQADVVLAMQEDVRDSALERGVAEDRFILAA
jgi:hypothetical protein